MSLGQLNVSTATSGSTSAIADTKQATLHGDNAWKDGACILVRDAAGASAAPEGEFSLVTAYTDSSGSFATTWTSAPASGDTFGFVNDFYPLYTVIELCNLALVEVGDIALVDTSLTTAADQTEYSLPVVAKRRRPYEVAIQTSADSDDNRWQPIYDWDYAPAAPGTVGKIVFRRQPPSGYTLRIIYDGIHPKLSAYTSVVSETIQPGLAQAAATEMCLRWQNSRLQGGDDFLLQRWNDAKVQLQFAKLSNPVWKPPRRARLFTLGRESARSRFTGDILA